MSAIRETVAHPLLEEVKKDVMDMILLMKKGEYHESVKCLRGASFNSDVYLCLYTSNPCYGWNSRNSYDSRESHDDRKRGIMGEMVCGVLLLIEPVIT